MIADCEVLLVQLEIRSPPRWPPPGGACPVGATVIVNASRQSPDAAGLAELAAVTDVVVVNEAEAAHWGHKTPHRVVTRGARGACYRGADGDFDVPAPEVGADRHHRRRRRSPCVLAAHWAGEGPTGAAAEPRRPTP